MILASLGALIMPTLNIEGHRVRVDDSFLKLSPDEQNATVEEIASSLIPEQTRRKGEFDGSRLGKSGLMT